MRVLARSPALETWPTGPRIPRNCQPRGPRLGDDEVAALLLFFDPSSSEQNAEATPSLKGPMARSAHYFVDLQLREGPAEVTRNCF